MKKLLLATATVLFFSSAAAYAQIDINVGIGMPVPAYVVPPQPAVIVPGHYHRIRESDRLYWQERKEREVWEHEHPGGHWDHDGWARAHR